MGLGKRSPRRCSYWSWVIGRQTDTCALIHNHSKSLTRICKVSLDRGRERLASGRGWEWWRPGRPCRECGISSQKQHESSGPSSRHWQGKKEQARPAFPMNAAVASGQFLEQCWGLRANSSCQAGEEGQPSEDTEQWGFYCHSGSLWSGLRHHGSWRWAPQQGQSMPQLLEKPSMSGLRSGKDNSKCSEKMEETTFLFTFFPLFSCAQPQAVLLWGKQQEQQGHLLLRTLREVALPSHQNIQNGKVSAVLHAVWPTTTWPLCQGQGRSTRQIKVTPTLAFLPEGVPENQKVMEKLGEGWAWQRDETDFNSLAKTEQNWHWNQHPEAVQSKQPEPKMTDLKKSPFSVEFEMTIQQKLEQHCKSSIL